MCVCLFCRVLVVTIIIISLSYTRTCMPKQETRGERDGSWRDSTCTTTSWSRTGCRCCRCSTTTKCRSSSMARPRQETRRLNHHNHHFLTFLTPNTIHTHTHTLLHRSAHKINHSKFSLSPPSPPFSSRTLAGFCPPRCPNRLGLFDFSIDREEDAVKAFSLGGDSFLSLPNVKGKAGT